MRRTNIFSTVFLFLILLSFTSCNKNTKKDNRIYLSENWTYSLLGAPSPFYDLPDNNLTNLSKLLPTGTGYVFLKTNFVIPSNYRHKNLHIYLGNIKIAAKVSINGHPLGQFGFFPPQEFTEGEKSASFNIPKEYINFGAENTLTISIWCNQYGSIKSIPFISDSDDITHKVEFDNLINSKIYMIFSVVLLFAFAIYFFLFLLRRSEIENLSFSLMCFTTACYLVPFYIGEYSIIYNNLYSFLLFEKLFKGAAAIFTSYFIISFTRDFLHYHESKSSRILRFLITVIAVTLPLLGKNIYYFRFFLRIGFFIMIVQFILPTKILIQALKARTPNAIQFLLCFIPIYVMLIVQFIFSVILKRNSNILLLAIGWLLVIFLFLGLLIIKFVHLAGKVEYMNKNLENLVMERTEALEKEKNRALQEIDLAGFVQKSFYKVDTSELTDWNLQITSKAMAGVSGDLYIVFVNEHHLEGIGIFDISGHGIAAGLVTMLVKNIIEQEFHKGKNIPLNKVMAKINDRIIIEKGNIENYLTGMLIRFNENDVELVNAGHPKAILYDSKNGKINAVEKEGINQYGAIGIADFPITFETLHFNVNKGDELVLYTDGITECTNSENKAFGNDGILAVFKSNIGLDVKDQVTALPAALRKFSGSDHFNDDITYIVLKKLVK